MPTEPIRLGIAAEDPRTLELARVLADRVGAARWAEAFNVEDDNFVSALPKPWRGTVEPVLRADVPVPAEVVAIDPDDALLEGRHIEKGVGHG